MAIPVMLGIHYNRNDMGGTHEHFYTFEAETNYALGCLMGARFRQEAERAIAAHAAKSSWEANKKRAREYAAVTARYFPQYVEELRGYAEGAHVPFDDLWTVSIEDELEGEQHEKCTTVVTNGGKLIAHNEDWEEEVCVVVKRIAGVSIFELYCFNTLGGNSLSINSHGFIAAVNSLYNMDAQIGVPHNVIARMFSETDDPGKTFATLQHVPRALGYSITIADMHGSCANIEYTAGNAVRMAPQMPFVHTNHYLSDLSKYDEAQREPERSTFARYEHALQGLRSVMSIEELAALMGDTSRGSEKSLLNARTRARVMIDVDAMVVHVWLAREAARGFVTYDLNTLFGHHPFLSA